MAVCFAPRRAKQVIYPTLKSQIETNSNLIGQKVGRKIYHVLATGNYSMISFSCLAVITGILEFLKSFRFLVTIISMLFSNAE